MPTGRCPSCSKPSELSPKNPFRPFCSERCKMVDLGGWLEGRYGIPVAEDDPLSEQPDESRKPLQ